VRIVEYNEIDPEYAQQKAADGSLFFKLANSNSFCFSMNFIESISHFAKSDFPLHQAKKVIAPYNKLLIKQEYFLFDMFEKAKKIGVLLADRTTSFAPLKNSEGADSPETAKRALLDCYRKLYEPISGVKLNENVLFELSTDFLYPSPKLAQQYKGKNPDPGSYLEEND
jgi:UDP-N-acetylglucosamine pyrophosphorylase